jgi:hypothetical protein
MKCAVEILNLVSGDMQNVSSIFEIKKLVLMRNEKVCIFKIKSFMEKHFDEVTRAKVIIYDYIFLSLTNPTDTKTSKKVVNMSLILFDVFLLSL